MQAHTAWGVEIEHIADEIVRGLWSDTPLGQYL
jgi:hypothetical protein